MTFTPAIRDLRPCLADDLPGVTELDLNPVIAHPGGAAVTSARIRLTPFQAHDPFLRRLR